VNDPKQRFILMLALGLTFLLVMQYFFPPSAPPAAPTVQQHVNAPAPQAALPTPSLQEASGEARAFSPEGDYTVTVTVGPEGKNMHGYEATFSSVGGGLSSYRLLGYYRLPMDDSPENRMILLDRLSPGRDSLRVDTVTYGASRQEMRTTSMRTARYELIEIPSFAAVSPAAPDARVGENLVFRTVVGDWEVVRTYRFPSGDEPRDFTIDLDIEWRNLASANQILSYSLIGPAGLIADDDSPNFGAISFLSARQPAASSSDVEIERKAIGELTKAANMADLDNRASLAWVGAKNRFFTAIMTTASSSLTDSNGATRMLFPGDPSLIPSARDIRDNLKTQPAVTTQAGEVPAFSEIGLTVEPGAVASGGSYRGSYQLYAGPAVDTWMARADARLGGVVSYTVSYFDFISRWLVQLLTFFDGILGNYGLAIIAATVIIKLILHPLNRKSFVSMNKMSKLAPQMKEIQKKYANDRGRMQQEMNKFYKDHGVSMAGGCLPIFIQLPIFFALYGAFSQGFSMRHAAFLPPWIKDLSKPDSIYDLGFQIPILGTSHISLLPILYFILQYIQMSLQPKPSDPQQAQQQKIMKIMPLMFVFIFYSMPAGLVLYFTISALCGVAENWYMRKAVLPKLGLGDTPEAAEVAAASTAAGKGAAQIPSEAGKKKRRK
jgi:YidC/Oxa1 family membrane protein insertase